MRSRSIGYNSFRFRCRLVRFRSERGFFFARRHYCRFLIHLELFDSCLSLLCRREQTQTLLLLHHMSWIGQEGLRSVPVPPALCHFLGSCCPTGMNTLTTKYHLHLCVENKCCHYFTIIGKWSRQGRFVNRFRAGARQSHQSLGRYRSGMPSIFPREVYYHQALLDGSVDP